ncbi:MAG: hypothetical protein QOJ53_1299 [Sphingomonadales bacterium]|nr:hypothetical protein [Sphingomonadales bacterium]
MKAGILGMCAAGAGGIYFLAGTPGPDFERVINKPPMTVYAAFSALGAEGVASEEAAGEGRRRISRRIDKELGEAIHYEILIDDRPVLDVDLHFAPGPDGRGTRMTAEFDMDAYELGSTYETSAGLALSMVPEGYIDQQFARFMDDMADDVEAGRPLPPLSLGRAGMRRASTTPTSLSERRYQAERDRREAAAPMNRARPMVDPNRDAERHLNGTR